MAAHQSVLTPTRTSSPSSEVVTMQQTDGTTHKLKPRLFHKSAHLWVHSADFYPSVNCTWQKAYAMTLKEEEALNQWLDEQLKVGLIVESKSWYAILCFYIPKKDGSLQLVQDYRKLNQIMIKDKMPLSLIREVIDKLKETKYFNKLDLIWGYNNVWIKEGDEWKATFLMNKGLFEP